MNASFNESDSAPTQRTPPFDVDDYLPARMINEAVYCHRLFYLMHVEGQFAPSADTEEGDQVHARVDQKVDALPAPAQRQLDLFDTKESVAKEVTIESPKLVDDTIHARSVTLSSESLGVVAKLDLVEGSGQRVTPVDYKRGSPKRGRDGMPTAWDPERVQICLQALVLRENGFECEAGVLYFAETRQRITIPIDADLIALTERTIRDARTISELSSPPPPLINSPKCPRCSLVAICLPDETNRCRSADQGGIAVREVRLPTTPRDDLRPLYLNTQGLSVGKSDEVLRVKENGKVIQEVRMKELNQVNLFGNIQISTQALQELAASDIPVVLHSQHGYYYGTLHGSGLKNILLRREQFRMADQSERCLKVAKQLVIGKIRNQRTLLMRNHIAPPESAIRELKRYASMVDRMTSAASLLGIEGSAARVYFEHFAGMLKPGDAPTDPLAAIGQPPKWSFDFRGRNRRPPRDPVNALLSLGYSLLTKDFAIACQAVGLDPYLGFFHLPRPGRPALPLDLMEPFRPLIVDSSVITAINTRMVYPEHFVSAGVGVTCTEPGRKAFFRAYEQRMDQLVTHPLFDYRVSYRRLLEIQTRLLARVITREIETYPVFVTR
ncbi:MAG: CRISPR-associated endonuclease Cas1 [Pirellulaceae bacterium]|nr:CRISPR-associated endonuclease Cas1 [Pirellulaceae bacterium]